MAVPHPTDPSLPADLLTAALGLPETARAELADQLLDSLGATAPPDPPGVREAWRNELERRIQAYLRGEVVALDAKESPARVRAQLREEFGYDV